MELDHAIGSGNAEELRTELGDVLLHVAFQIVLAEESGAFGAEDLVRQVERKMWRRHPHLFPDTVDGAEDAAAPRSWERVKLAENADGHSVLEGLPPGLPALVHALRLQERAAGVGFDWDDADGPRAKVDEELEELDEAVHEEEGRASAEIGDLLFAVVNLARKLECDPRGALEQANRKFERRFRAVEVLARERGIQLGHASLEELDALWDDVKKNGEDGGSTPSRPDQG